MTNLLPAWLAKSMDAFRRLAGQPLALFALLLAVNALARPYCNCFHDARLYALQVINQAEGGAFSDDVFLRFGSQDQYSIFSHVVAPLTALGGVRATFFALYLIFNTIFLWGMYRLVRALVDDPIIAAAALIYLATADLNYGGHWIFTVHEQFFTPRLVATGLTLHALAFIVAQRFVPALALLAIGMVVHPLMTLGGVLIWIGCLAKSLLSNRTFWSLFAGAAAGGLAVVAVPSVGVRLFGGIDPDWHDMVHNAAVYNYPASWTVIDWFNVVLAFALCIAGFVWLFRDDPARARFLFIANLVGVIGLTATVIASMSPYALLFQGQPYRAVWILKVLQIPLGFMALARLSESTALVPRLLAIGLAGFFVVATYCASELLLLLFALPIAAFYWRKLDEPVRSDWWWRAAMCAIVVGAFGWMLYSWGFIFAERMTILANYDQAELIRLPFEIVPAAFWIAAVLLVLRGFKSERSQRQLAWICAFVALAVPSIHFGLDAAVPMRDRLTRHSADIAFARQVIEAHADGRVPAVYSSLGRAEYVWLDLHATSYYDGVQTAGVMFRRDTALELRRRIPFVRAFEMARLRKQAVFLTDGAKALIERTYGSKFDGPGPNEADLVRLCQEPGLDFVILPHEFPGLYSATNGRIFVYECSRLRLSNGRLAASAKPHAAQTPITRNSP